MHAMGGLDLRHQRSYTCFGTNLSLCAQARFRPHRHLMPQDLLGLWSCLQVGITVHLWSYSPIHLFRHSRLRACQAASLLPLSEAMSLLKRGLRVQLLADFVRYRAAQEHGRTVGAGSWVGDLDQIWIRPFGTCPSRSGHIFATMHARWDSRNGPGEDFRYWKVHFVRFPDERVHFSNSPMAFPAESEVLDSSLSKIQILFSQRQDLSKMDYTACVRIVLDSIRASGLALDVVDPVVFHPIPHFARGCHVFTPRGSITWTTTIAGVELPSTEQILSDSSTVSQTWFSWSKENLVDRIVQPGSLYSALFTQLGLPSLDGKSLRQLSTVFRKARRISIQCLALAAPRISILF